MEIEQLRIDQGERGTNSEIWYDGKQICYAIELPWLDNQRRVSCIPEGRYRLKKRYSAKFGWHLHIENVPNRSLILIHPANNAIKELNGCIAPVSTITGLGRGIDSKKAFQRLFTIVSKALEQGESVHINIKSK